MTFDPLEQYLTEIREAPRLAEHEEIELVYRIKAGLDAARRLEKDIISPDERRALARDQADGESAKRELVEASLRLVVAAALRHPDVGPPLLDLIQEGNIGLIRAVERFDPEMGERFEEFATPLIVEAIRATEG